jgi:hypothetical protein
MKMYGSACVQLYTQLVSALSGNEFVSFSPLDFVLAGSEPSVPNDKETKSPRDGLDADGKRTPFPQLSSSS